MAEQDREKEAVQPDTEQQPQVEKQETSALETLKKIKDNVSEDDSLPAGTLTLRKILGGDILSADLVRRQVGLFMLIVAFIVLSVAFRYQCQQDIIQIDKLEKELKDAKWKALGSSSKLTEKCRESHVLEGLRQHKDSTLHPYQLPPYIIYVPEDE